MRKNKKEKILIIGLLLCFSFILNGCNNNLVSKIPLGRMPGIQLVVGNKPNAKQKVVQQVDIGLDVDRTYSFDEMMSIINGVSEDTVIILGNKGNDGKVSTETIIGNLTNNPFIDVSEYYVYRGQQNGAYVFQTDIIKAEEVRKQKESEERRLIEAAKPKTYKLKTIKSLISNKLNRNDSVVLYYGDTKVVIRNSNIEELNNIPVDDFIYTGKKMTKIGNYTYNFEKEGYKIEEEVEEIPKEISKIEKTIKETKELLHNLFPNPKEGWNLYGKNEYYYDTKKEDFVVNDWVLLKSNNANYYYWVFFFLDGQPFSGVTEDGYKLDEHGRLVDDNNEVIKYEKDGTTLYKEPVKKEIQTTTTTNKVNEDLIAQIQAMEKQVVREETQGTNVIKTIEVEKEKKAEPQVESTTNKGIIVTDAVYDKVENNDTANSNTQETIVSQEMDALIAQIKAVEGGIH